MCLLDSVDSWDELRINCLTDSHHLPDNPLRDTTRLASVNAIEYGAQAVAIHGRLISDESDLVSRSGFLVQIKNLDFQDCDLSMLSGALNVQAEQIHCDSSSMLYTITIKHDQQQIMSGRIMIFITEQS
ncbi:MAG: 3-hydroxylacyl-ACP dehydratase [Gammaproteobacteria bacterium]|nr:3-hydroxylacyl-ACP dehydratase [Gammaproteobacteria bacterium]